MLKYKGEVVICAQPRPSTTRLVVSRARQHYVSILAGYAQYTCYTVYPQDIQYIHRIYREQIRG